MIWNVAAGVMLGLAPFFFAGCGFYTALASDRYREEGRDIHWRAGIWFACGVLCVAAIATKILAPGVI